MSERQLDVLEDSHVADKVEVLKHETDLGVANAREGSVIELFHDRLIEGVATGGRGVEQPKYRQQRRFPAAGRACDRHELALEYFEIDLGQRVRLDLVGVEGLRDTLE